jgi:SAM-dependent methyltransferase
MQNLFRGDRTDSLRLQLLGWAGKLTEIFNAAIELQLFSKVSQGADSVEAIAEALDITPLNAERLATACVALDLLRSEGGRYVNAPDVERFLVLGKRNYTGPWYQWWRRKDHPGWHNLTEYLRRKEPAAVLGETYANYSVQEARDFHEGMFAVGIGAAHLFHRNVDLSTRRLILDLGGGSGHYCIVAAQRYPQIEAIVFDLPEVTIVTQEYISESDLSGRVRTQAGDFTRDPFPQGADVTLLNGSLTVYGPDAARNVIGKAYDAMVPEGEMHIVFEMLDNDRSGPVNAALFGVYEALMGSEGQAHSVADVVGYMEAAGFVDVAQHHFLDKYIRRVSGYKRA